MGVVLHLVLETIEALDFFDSFVAKATASAAVGKRSSSIPHTAAIGCRHVLLTGVENDFSR